VLNDVVVMQHISGGTTYSPCVSLTKSFGVARDYAMNAGFNAPSPTVPAYVYEIHIPEKSPGVKIIDPVDYIASRNANPLALPRTYHHDGDQQFLGFVAYSLSAGGAHPAAPVPPGLVGGRPVHLSDQTQTIVFAMRDAEVLVHGSVPHNWIVQRYDIF